MHVAIRVISYKWPSINYVVSVGEGRDGVSPKDIILKFTYSEKATKFCEISTLLLSYIVSLKNKVDISHKFVAFSEYMNFSN